MRKQAWIINVLLIAAAAGVAVKLRGDWTLANQRYEKLNTRVSPKAPAASSSLPAATSVASPGNSPMNDAIVQNNLFTPDRNNNIPQPVQSTPPPPLPVFTGSINLGNGHPIALMSETPAGAPRQVKEGETIGGYKVDRIADSFVMVEYDGQKKRVEVQSAPQQTSAPPAYTAEQRTAPSAPPPAVTNVMPSTPPRVQPGNKSSTGFADTRTSRDMFGQDGVDKYPAGTVIDGWKKVERTSPFGSQVWWQKVNP